MGLIDLASGYAYWAPFSFVIQGLMALGAAAVLDAFHDKRNFKIYLLSFVVGGWAIPLRVGAALDVFTVEPVEVHNPLLHLNNPYKIVLTPHSAWLSAEAKETLFSGVLENIDSFYSGGVKNRIETPMEILMKEKKLFA